MTKPICLKNEEMEINKENIWEGDLFSRNKVAEDFTKIITSIEQPFVLSINSSYGSGKTFFLKRWAEELKQKGETVVFFNAWDCDFVEKPLLPFLYNFIEQLKEQNLVKYDLITDIKNCGDILFTCFKHFIFEGSNGILDIDELKQKTDANSMSLPKVENLYEYNQLRNILAEFKKDIDKLVKTLSGKNIYIFVDELERCRPIFAIELLEAIKHLFNVKGLVFILGIDRSQLKHTISNIYGCGMDGEGYLRRFIDLELELPKPDIQKYTENLQNIFDIHNKDNSVVGRWTTGYDEFNTYFNLFASIYPMQLRDIEQIYAKFNVITKMLDEKVNKIMPILALLMILKIKDIKLYNQFTIKSLSIENFENFIGVNIYSKFNNLDENQQYELDKFLQICRAISNNNYYEIVQKIQNQYESPETVPIEVRAKISGYNNVIEIQRALRAYNRDLIQYLKNMIGYIR